MSGKPKLIVLSEKLRGKSFELDKDVVSVGRTDKTDICIKDPTISSHHCDFIRKDNTYVLKDNGSTNGTRVNNVPVKEQILKNSDILQLGGVEILFDSDDGTTTSVTRTHTGIDLDSTEVGLSTVKNLDNLSPFKNDRRNGSFSQKILLALVILLVLAILILVGAVVWMGVNQTPEAVATIVGSSL
ncbi:MAG: FHA domain-containing protein [Lentisphaerae bacterium]|nr:FHA domain-containing protein [Lentisphaerota bacterium]MCP4101490.1 FHA domain-containing protein [Lentisphaerota bacterium]